MFCQVINIKISPVEPTALYHEVFALTLRVMGPASHLCYSFQLFCRRCYAEFDDADELDAHLNSTDSCFICGYVIKAIIKKICGHRTKKTSEDAETESDRSLDRRKPSKHRRDASIKSGRWGRRRSGSFDSIPQRDKRRRQDSGRSSEEKQIRDKKRVKQRHRSCSSSGSAAKIPSRVRRRDDSSDDELDREISGRRHRDRDPHPLQADRHDRSSSSDHQEEDFIKKKKKKKAKRRRRRSSSSSDSGSDSKLDLKKHGNEKKRRKEIRKDVDKSRFGGKKPLVVKISDSDDGDEVVVVGGGKKAMANQEKPPCDVMPLFFAEVGTPAPPPQWLRNQLPHFPAAVSSFGSVPGYPTGNRPGLAGNFYAVQPFLNFNPSAFQHPVNILVLYRFH